LVINSRGLDGFLLLAREAGKTVGKGFGDEEVHVNQPNRQFIL